MGRANTTLEADVAVVGAGAAGLSLARRLVRAPRAARAPSVLLIDAPPGPLRPPARTWCYWEEGDGEFDAVLTASWPRLRVHGRDGGAVVRALAPLRYKMLRSGAFEAMAGAELSGSGAVRRVVAAVDAVRDGAEGAEVHGRAADGTPVWVRARWAFDSRPPSAVPPGRTTLLQHFHGWFVHTERPVFDPGVVDLMDFRLPQPAAGLAFGYVLPTGRHDALVEYTEFTPLPSRTSSAPSAPSDSSASSVPSASFASSASLSTAVLGGDAYDRALRRYTDQVLGLGPLEIRATETGAIPMTDAPLHLQPGRSVFRIGTAGGATRASTGYTFTAVQRQARAVADAYHAGRRPQPPPCHSRRARFMDAALLRALHTGRMDGADCFARLFRRVPVGRLLRFLDGGTRLGEDVLVGLRTPVLPMLRTVAELPLLRPSPTPTRP